MNVKVESKQTYRSKGAIGAHVFAGEKPAQVSLKPHGDTTFLGVVVRVNTDAMSMDILLKINGKSLTDIPYTAAYTGPAGFMGVCPEVGTLVVLIETEVGLLPLTYLVPQPEFALSYELLSMFPKDLADPIKEQHRIIPAKLRRLRPGEAYVSSSHGSSAFFDEDAEITDSMDNCLRVRSGDGSIIATSQQNYLFANGVWRSAGPIQRNSLDFKVLGDEIGGYEASEVIQADGMRCVYIGGDYQYQGVSYNEYRVEVEDSNILGKQVNDVNEGYNKTLRRPKSVFIMGNMVGNDALDTATYGKFLAPSFIPSDRGQGHLGFAALTPSGNDDVLGTRGVAWALHVPGKNFVGADKSGAMHMYFGEAHGDTPGVSQFLVAMGGRREEWGVMREGGLSWDLFCRGGISWTVGKSVDNPSRGKLPRSAVVRFLGGTYTEYGADETKRENRMQAMDGSALGMSQMASYKRVERVAGKSREEVSSDKEVQVGSNLVEQLGGSRKVGVGGSYSESTVGDRTISTLGTFSVNALTEIQTKAPQRAEVFLKGDDKKKLLLGDDATEIAVGNQTLKVLAGSAKRAVVAGSIEDSVITGNHTTTVAAGNVSTSVTAGNISLATAAGTVSVGGISVSVKAAASIDLTAPLVGLGNPVTRSGVITFLSHRDYVTGAPLIPSFTVTAGL